MANTPEEMAAQDAMAEQEFQRYGGITAERIEAMLDDQPEELVWMLRGLIQYAVEQRMWTLNNMIVPLIRLGVDVFRCGINVRPSDADHVMREFRLSSKQRVDILNQLPTTIMDSVSVQNMKVFHELVVKVLQGVNEEDLHQIQGKKLEGLVQVVFDEEQLARLRAVLLSRELVRG